MFLDEVRSPLPPGAEGWACTSAGKFVPRRPDGATAPPRPRLSRGHPDAQHADAFRTAEPTRRDGERGAQRPHRKEATI